MNAPKDVKRETLAVVAEIDRDELFLRVAQAGVGDKWPKRVKPCAAAKELMNMADSAKEREVFRDFDRMASAALEYFIERVKAQRDLS